MIKDIEMLFPYAKEFENEFRKYVNEIQEEKKVKTENGYACYVKDNIEIAKLIPKDKIVVDVGCSFGLQQVLFQNHKGYVGIQKFRNGVNADKDFIPTFKIFTKNAKIIEGNFRDVYQQIGITEKNKDNFWGVANKSLWNDLETNKKDIGLFKGLFPQNYYATNEAGVAIKY